MGASPLRPTIQSAFLRSVCGATQSLDVLATDTHYKYLAIMLIPAGTGFVIANWVGWQYYRNS